jgi:hypothetical protein
MQYSKMTPVMISVSPGNPYTFNACRNDSQRITYAFTIPPQNMSLTVLILDTDGKTQILNQTFTSGLLGNQTLGRVGTITFTEANFSYSFTLWYKIATIQNETDELAANTGEGIQYVPLSLVPATSQGFSYALPTSTTASTNVPTSGTTFTASMTLTAPTNLDVLIGIYVNANAVTLTGAGTLTPNFNGTVLTQTTTSLSSYGANTAVGVYSLTNVAPGAQTLTITVSSTTISGSNTGSFGWFVIQNPTGAGPFTFGYAYSACYAVTSLFATIGVSSYSVGLTDVASTVVTTTAITNPGSVPSEGPTWYYTWHDQNNNQISGTPCVEVVAAVTTVSGLSSTPSKLVYSNPSETGAASNGFYFSYVSTVVLKP